MIGEFIDKEEQKSLAFEVFDFIIWLFVSIFKSEILQGMKYAEQAYALDPNNAMSNKWMGIMTR